MEESKGYQKKMYAPFCHDKIETQQTMFVPTRKMSPRMDFESLYNALSPLNKIPIA